MTPILYSNVDNRLCIAAFNTEVDELLLDTDDDEDELLEEEELLEDQSLDEEVDCDKDYSYVVSADTQA